VSRRRCTEPREPACSHVLVTATPTGPVCSACQTPLPAAWPVRPANPALALVLVALFVLSAPALAQDARAIVLSADETREARAAWDAIQAAEKRYAEVKERIATRHRDERCARGYSSNEAAPWPCSTDFTFSLDFRVIVAPPPSVPASPWHLNTLPLDRWYGSIGSTLRPIEGKAELGVAR
jgi:hypothetical protein